MSQSLSVIASPSWYKWSLHETVLVNDCLSVCYISLIPSLFLWFIIFPCWPSPSVPCWVLKQGHVHARQVLCCWPTFWQWTWNPTSSALPLTKHWGHKCISACLAFSGTPLCGLKNLGCPSHKWHSVHLILPPASKMHIFSDILKWLCFEWTGIVHG